MSNPSDAANFAGTAFGIGVVTGARSFRVDEDGWLTGVVYRQRWDNTVNESQCRISEHSITFMYYPPYGNVQARLDPKPPVVKPPHLLTECHCGFYAFFDGSNDYHRTGSVWGVVEGFGETLIGTRGFRSRKTRIVALCLSDRVAEDLAEKVRLNYWNVPFFDTFEDMVEAFPPDAAEREDIPQEPDEGEVA